MPQSPLNIRWTAKKSTGLKTYDDNDCDAIHAQPSAYESAQCEEILVLQAIFMDDYEDVETQHAWARTSQRCFKLRLRASSESSISLVLGVTMTLTYPKSIPLLHVEDVQGLRHKTLERIQSIIRTLPLKLVGEVMINEIAVNIQDALEDAAVLQAQEHLVPSLEQERVDRETIAAKLAEQKDADHRRQLDEEQAEEDRAMQRMVDEELKRRLDSRRRQADSSAVPRSEKIKDASLTLTIAFDQPIRMLAADASDIEFNSIAVLGKLAGDNISQVFSACPVMQFPSPVCLVVKRVNLRKCKKKEGVLKLENDLEKLKSLQNANTVKLLDFRFSNQNFDWNVDILMEHASHGSLRDLLQMAGTLSPQKARPLAIDTLQALDFYHKNGIVHGRMHCGNVLLTALPNGATIIKLADAAFQDTLHVLKDEARDRSRSTKKETLAWRAPEIAMSSTKMKTRKTDVWEFGVVFVEMLFGFGIAEKFLSPQAFLNSSGLSEPLEDLLRDILRTDPKRRPSAFDVIPYEFLRTDAPVIRPTATSLDVRTAPSEALHSPKQTHSRHKSQHAGSSSRYHNEWNEAGRLGRGGYGEVVKARNKLDGRIYAIKKITDKTPSELNQVLSEVYMLATLNHPFVVRYFSAWPEDEIGSVENQSVDTTSSDGNNGISTSEAETSFAFGESTGGFDLMSSSGYPRIEFGEDDSDEEDGSIIDEDLGNIKVSSDDRIRSEVNASSSESGQITKSSSHEAGLEVQRSRSASRLIVKTTLYIQMEFCERLTLRDMIRRGIHRNLDDIWRLLRQILDGLVHIHSHGIIHRDLKPENIFIDDRNSPKIGDFGLATTGQYHLADSHNHAHIHGGDMTRSIGTTLYVAPELRSNVSGHYTDKVDMYSLGIIFFEMCYPLKTAMERYQTLNALREHEHSLPEDFGTSEKQAHGDIILSLIKHRPSERPSSVGLLRSGKIPALVEDETIKLALNEFLDVNSPYYHKMLSALFCQPDTRQLKDQMWEMSGDQLTGQGASDYMLTQSMVKDRMIACFRRHGAVESSRQTLFPRSEYYGSANVVQLLDASGTLVQLPYDLTLPHARAIAREGIVAARTYTFGTVFREAASGYAPRGGREADFDLVSYDAADNTLREAEVIKVMDEIFEELPSFANVNICFHVNHARVLDMICDFCRIGVSQKVAAKAILGKLNLHSWTWSRIRTELRAPNIGISSTSLDELARFDFRDTIKKSHVRLTSLLPVEYHERLENIFQQLQDLDETTGLFGVKHRIYWCPLSSFNEPFYKNAVMFQCLYDGKKRDILAAGGRYDSLVEAHKPKYTGGPALSGSIHAVGINIVWDRLTSSMIRYQKQAGRPFLKKVEAPDPEHWMARRCECLVASFDPTILRSNGLQILNQLWSNDISAELAIETRLPEELLAHYRDERFSWIIIVKHDISSTKPDIKVKNMEKHEDTDIRSSELVSYLRGEIRDRDQRHNTAERAKLHRHASQPETSAKERMGPVTVLQSNLKRKIRLQKWHAVEAAQAKAGQLAASMTDGAPIASTEIRDEVLEMIRGTRLSDPDSWRRVIQHVPLAERDYMQLVHDVLSRFKIQHGMTTRNCFIHSYKTGSCIYYDLGL